jgi:hypothetical protein
MSDSNTSNENNNKIERNPKLARTPVKTNQQSYSNKRPKRGESSDEDEQNLQKEKNYTINDLMSKICENSNMQASEFSAIRNDIAALRQEVNCQIDMIREKVDNVEMYVEGIKSRMDEVDTKLEQITEKSAKHDVQINRMLQDKLECHMEISGIDHEVISKSSDITELAITTMKSQGIEIDKNDIERVTKRVFNVTDKDQVQIKKGIITVVFKEFEKKVQVMKSKRSTQKRDETIFFNIALTPTNRHLMFKCKEITKGKLKTYYGRGSVRVTKNDKTEFIIDEACKLEELKKYMASSKPVN